MGHFSTIHSPMRINNLKNDPHSWICINHLFRLHSAYLQDGVCLAEFSERMVSSGELVRADVVPAP